MARKGTGYFDRKGQFFKTARDATASDLAGMLGQIGEGESLGAWYCANADREASGHRAPLQRA